MEGLLLAAVGFGCFEELAGGSAEGFKISLKLRHRSGMHVRIHGWSFAGIGMPNHAPNVCEFTISQAPSRFSRLQGDRHTGTGRAPGLGSKLDLRVTLIAIDGNTAYIHIHGAQVERADGRQVLLDACTNRVVVTHPLLAGT